MMNERLFPLDKHNIFFKLLKDIPYNRYTTFLPVLTSRLKKMYSLRSASVYIYNAWKGIYERFDKEQQLPPYFHDVNELENQSFQNRLDAENRNTTAVEVIPIVPRIGPNGFLITVDTTGTNSLKDEINALKGMLDNVCNYLNVYEKNIQDKEKSDFLFECASRFYAINRKSKILEAIVQSLQKLYPDYVYYLLLSQDNEADQTLPIKTMEYSDDATKQASEQAFLSGEIQLENRLYEKRLCLYAPLRGKQGIYGVLQIITPAEIQFPKTEIDFVTKFANTAGQAIENVSLYEYAKHLVTDLKLINDTTHQLNLNLELAEITKLVSKQIVHICKAKEIGFIYFNDMHEDAYDILVGSTPFFRTKKGKRFAAGLRKQMDNEVEPVLRGDYQESDDTFPYRSVMIIPMIQSGTIYGVTTMMHEKSYFFSFEAFKLMQSLVQHSTLALSNALLKGELEKTIITDYLTKLYSRNHLDDSINIHMQKGTKGAFILFDIDDFKHINDLYGHRIGDDVIIQTAKIIQNNMGLSDISARWGGEELAVYLPEASIQKGVLLSKRIVEQVSDMTEPNITLSSGVSSWTNKEEDSVGELFARADKALYSAKETGKNRVEPGY